jgi:hypothetical protein
MRLKPYCRKKYTQGIFKILFFIVFVIPAHISAQENQYANIDSIAGKMIEDLRSHSVEKILLTTNKPMYAAGETLWFKAFIIDSINSKLINKSKILYADFVNDKDSVIKQLLFNAGKLQTSGHILLDNSLPQGYYWLRAYTKALISENKSDVAILPVYVFSKIENDVQDRHKGKMTTPGAQNTQPQIEIYPEGGQLISGINCVVALKAHDAKGEPIKLSGVIKDSKTVVAKFSTNNNGLAKFNFEPKWYEKYAVYIENNGSYDSAAILPKVNLYAAQLSVQEKNQQFIKAQVMLEDSIYSKTYTTYILALHEDSICFAGIGHGRYQLNIPLANFPAGIAHLFLFNEQKQLVSERDVYIDKQDVKVDINTDKENYDARENVKLGISVADATGKPLLANLTVAVTDIRVLDTADNFLKDEFVNKHADEIDLEMLVRKTTLPGSITLDNAALYRDSLVTFSGTVMDKKQTLMQDVQVMLMSTQGTTMILQDTSNAAGKFSFSLPEFNDSTRFTLQTADMNGRKQQYHITPDPFNFPSLKTPASAKKRFQPQQMQLVNAIRQNHLDSIIKFGEGWLSPVTVKTSKSEKDNKQPKNIITQQMLLNGGANDVGLAVLANGKFHLINGYLMEGGPNNQNGVSANDEPLIVVDGQVISTSPDGITGSPVLSYLKTLNASDIDYIKILGGFEASMYGVRGGHGVIEIHSAKSYTNNSSNGEMKDFSLQGFQTPMAFPMPDYTKKQVKNSKTPDVRTTIYWNGNIITDSTGKASLNFFTADPATTYLITVTGVTANGFKIFKTSTISRN